MLDGLAFTDEGGLLVSCYRPDRIYHLGADGALGIVADDPQGTILSAPTNVCFVGVGARPRRRGESRPLAPDAARARPPRRAAAPAGALGAGRVVTSFVPRYYEIEQALRARIAVLDPGDVLPSDSALCEEFGVSRMTARHAVQVLTQEGLVERIRGRGTFVAEPSTHRQAGNLLSFTTEMRRQKRVPSSRLLERRVRRATPEEAARLKLKPDAQVVVVRRLRLADGQPIVVETAVLREACAEAVLAADLDSGSLHETLFAAGFAPTRGRGILLAEAATDDDADVLGVPAGAPLLVEQRLIEDERGRPLESTESRYAGNRYGLHVDFDVDRPR